MALARLLLTKIPPEKLVILHFEHNPQNPKQEMTQLVKKTFSAEGCRVVTGELNQLTQGNLEQAWREARYQFFNQAREQYNLAGIFLGHTQNDLAETVLMRLAKGSGLTGLVPMRLESEREGMLLLRPLLNEQRESLQAYLTDTNTQWLDDPSNEDMAFQRVRLRALQSDLEQAGITSEGIAASVASLARADGALEAYTQQFIARRCQQEEGKIVIEADLLEIQPEIALRVIKWVILSLNPMPMAPRSSKRERLLENLKQAQPGELGGVRFMADAGHIVAVAESINKT